MRTPFKVHISGKDRVVIRMAGAINEAAELELVHVPRKVPIEIDMVSVTSINSMGIRSFREWSKKIENPELELSYCPKVFVDQMNMVVNLIPPQARVVSFYVPYYCEATGEEKSVLFVNGEHYVRHEGQVKINWPKVTDANGNEFAPDIIPQRYLGFLDLYG